MNILSVLSLLALGSRLKRVKEVVTTIDEKASGSANVTAAQAWSDHVATKVVPLPGAYEGRRWGWIQDPPNVSMPKVYFYVYVEERAGWGAWHMVGRGDYIPHKVVEAQYQLQASQAIEMGTVLICVPPPDDENQDAVIFASVTRHDVIGHARAGDQVVATGPPHKTADGSDLVSIFPSGAVALNYFHVAGTAHLMNESGESSYSSEYSPSLLDEDEAIDNGTTLVCVPPLGADLEDAEILASLTEYDVIGHVRAGDEVVATGRPHETADGLVLVPIEPSGVVELGFFRVAGEQSPSSTSSSSTIVVGRDAIDEAINMGTVLVCVPPPDDELEDADILASLTEHDVIGNVAAGDQVVATGPPHDIGAGILLVPIDPSGAVELSYFQVAAAAPTAHADLEALEATVQAQWEALGILYDRQLQQATVAGTRLVCVPPEEDEDRSAVIFSGHETDTVGTVLAGDHVVATGPPETMVPFAHGVAVVPVEPSGRVLLKYFRLAGGPEDPYVGSERWQVVHKAGVNVRTTMDVFSERLCEKKRWTILHGRTREGYWLELVGEPGFIMLGEGGLLERVSEDEDQAKRETAAIRIQAVQRGILARQKAKGMKEKAAALQAAVEAEERLVAAAATRIQKAQRARQAVKITATTRIKAAQRGRKGRQVVKSLKDVKERSLLSKVATVAVQTEGEAEAFPETAKRKQAQTAETAERKQADCKSCVGHHGPGCWRLKKGSEWWHEEAWECSRVEGSEWKAQSGGTKTRGGTKTLGNAEGSELRKAQSGGTKAAKERLGNALPRKLSE